MISVVVPIFNEAAGLDELRRRLIQSAEQWSEPFEIIAVDDGSSDETASRLRAFRETDNRWKILTFSRNFGHQAAVSAGLHYARGDAVVVIDADMQDPPEVIIQLIEQWRNGWQVVYAVRTQRKEGLWKRMAYAGFYRLWRWAADINVPLDAGDFCLLDRDVLRVLRKMPERNRFLRGLRCWAGFRHVGVEYERQARSSGDSKYSLIKLLRLASNGMMAFSSAPLRLASAAGCSLLATAFATGLGSVAVWWMGASATWIAVLLFATTTMLTTGTQLLITGIFGEYIAHLLEETKRRPPWVIAEAQGVTPRRDRLGWFVEGSSSRRRNPIAHRSLRLLPQSEAQQRTDELDQRNSA